MIIAGNDLRQPILTVAFFVPLSLELWIGNAAHAQDSATVGGSTSRRSIVLREVKQSLEQLL